jgi:ribosomal-protein-serine acetyltransferase
MKLWIPLDESAELRLLDYPDTQTWFELITSDREHMTPWFGWIDTFQTVEDAHQFIQVALTQYANNVGMKAGLWVDGALVGGVSYQEIDWNNSIAVIGAWVSHTYEGKGHIYKALLALTQYAFSTLRINRVEARTAVENVRGQRLMERLNFTNEGILRNSLLVRDRYLDEVVYGALNGQWVPPPPRS